LHRGIAQARPGNRLGDISHAIQTYAESFGFSVVREYVGHGVGAKLHEDPEIPNYGEPGHGPRLIPGMTIAIEPMINMGGWKVVLDRKDQWTVRTADGSLSAQFEHTVVVTEDGIEVLTLTPSQIAEGVRLKVDGKSFK